MDYFQLHKKDLEVITVLTTFEHLCVLCEKNISAKKLLPPQSSDECQIHELSSSPSIISPQANIRPVQENVSIIPYCFNLLSLLPKCSQTEIIVSAVHCGNFFKLFLAIINNNQCNSFVI